MTEHIKRMTRMSVQEWFYSLASATISGGAGAVAQGLTLAAFDLLRVDFSQTQFYQTVIVLFSVNAVVSLANYLRQSPIPPLKTDPGTTELPAGR